jgi:hypothetical protein
MDPALARKAWRTLEPYHGLVYFAPEPERRYAAMGMGGFDAYFPSRAAAMGAVGPDVVVATFFNFRPSRVHAALPRAWDVAPPSAWIDARLAGVDEALRRILGGGGLDGGGGTARAAELAGAAADAAGEWPALVGRPLGAAHAAVARSEQPHLALWQAVTVLREHRGDGHVACLVEAGITGCEALVLHAASGEVPADVLRRTRGWTDDEWSAAVDGLASRGLVDGDGAFTGAGRALRQRIEDRTDELAAGPWTAIGADGCEELRALVRPLSRAIVEAGGLR